MKLGLLSIALFEATSVVFAAQPLSARQSKSVDTTSGPVTGHPASPISNVTEYLGIPFAKPPVGDLRFAPPEKYAGTDAVNGTSFGFSCPATTAFAAGGGSTSSFNIAGANLTSAGFGVLTALAQIGEKFSEDCLTLNIWVPSGGESKKAILVWIYGGGFNTGSTITKTYNGQNLANQEDVIIVSINYRLNIFGFPGNPAVPNKNLGLLDQRLAIEWVRDNIPKFGGDTDRITIFGQSAGSASVDYYSFAYVSDPIVAGFIQESGTINGFSGPVPASSGAAWFNVSSALDCGSSSDDAVKVLDCMRTKNYTSILQAAAKTQSSFGPSADELTVYSDYPARAAAGNFTKLPLLIGNADYENGLYATLAALQNQTQPRSYWEAGDLRVFSCPAAVRANISISAGVRTWRYRWFGDFPNTRLTSVPDSGAYHTSELPVLFDTLPSGSGIPNTTTEEATIGTYFRGAWAAFAKDPVNGLEKYGWPLYLPSEDTLVRLAYNNQTGANLANPILYDASCPTVFAYNGTSNSSASPSSTPSGTPSASGKAAPSSTPTKPAASSLAGNRFASSGFAAVMAALVWLVL